MIEEIQKLALDPKNQSACRLILYLLTSPDGEFSKKKIFTNFNRNTLKGGIAMLKRQKFVAGTSEHLSITSQLVGCLATHLKNIWATRHPEEKKMGDQTPCNGTVFLTLIWEPMYKEHFGSNYTINSKDEEHITDLLKRYPLHTLIQCIPIHYNNKDNFVANKAHHHLGSFRSNIPYYTKYLKDKINKTTRIHGAPPAISDTASPSRDISEPPLSADERRELLKGALFTQYK